MSTSFRIVATVFSLPLSTLVLSGCIATGTSTPLPALPPAASSASPSAAPTSDCDGGIVRFTQSRTDTTFSGTCEVVEISGDDIDLDLTRATVTSLRINGQDNEVDAADLESVVVAGDDNDVDARKVGTAEFSGQKNELDATSVGLLTFTGDRNEAEIIDSVDAITFNGNGNQVVAPRVGAVTDKGSRNVVRAR